MSPRTNRKARPTVTVPPDKFLPTNFEIQKVFEPLIWSKFRYKVLYGGRGAAKSWSIARSLLILACQRYELIGCFREIQATIGDSVYRLLIEQIELMGLHDQFYCSQSSIVHLRTGAEFIFKGLRGNATEIKSMEGVTIAWIEEAQLVSNSSWELLIPTIRREGSEIWISFNPADESDPTYVRFVLNTPPNSWVRKVSYRDNKYFPSTLDAERLHLLETDPEAYEHVWEGSCRVISEAIIFKGRYVVQEFEMPVWPKPRLFHGADWGFANDPTCLIRSWMTVEPAMELKVAGLMRKFSKGEHLWIDNESFGWKVEMDNIPELFDKIDTARNWPIKGDAARPETISYIRRQGFNITEAEKWTGSVEDGIAHLKAFKIIHIHPRCVHLLREMRLYCYKVEKQTGEILPVIVDKNNHGVDALRYGMDGFIQRRGVASVWARQ